VAARLAELQVAAVALRAVVPLEVRREPAVPRAAQQAVVPDPQVQEALAIPLVVLLVVLRAATAAGVAA
jgi:hypothetical protein